MASIMHTFSLHQRKPQKLVKGLNCDAVAIKMVDNPPDLQAVIPNEIIIIFPLKEKK